MKIYLAASFLVTVVREVLSTNILANFPAAWNMYNQDILGFNINQFINGTQNKDQVFPSPNISKFPEEKNLHNFNFDLLNGGWAVTPKPTYISSCSKVVQSTNLEFALLCKGYTQDTKGANSNFISLQRFDRDMKQQVYFQTLLEGNKGNFDCHDIAVVDGFVFVVCLKDTKGPAEDPVIFALNPTANANPKFNILDDAKKIDIRTFKGSVTEENLKLHKLRLSVVKQSPNRARIVMYQALNRQIIKIFSKNEISNLIAVVDFEYTTSPSSGDFLNSFDKSRVVVSNVDAFPMFSGNETPQFDNKMSLFLLNDFNLLVESLDRQIFQCKLNNPKLDTDSVKIICLAAIPDGRDDPTLEKQASRLEMRTLSADYIYESKQAVIYYSDYKSCIRCRLVMKTGFESKQASMTIEFKGKEAEKYMSCKTIDFDFTQAQTQTLIASDFGIEKSQNNAIMSLYIKQGNPGSASAGYLRINFDKYYSNYHDLRFSQGSYLSPINSTHYVLSRGDHTSLHQRTRSKFYIRGNPKDKFSSNVDVFLSSYNPARNEEPLIMTTKLNYFTDHFDQVSSLQINATEIDDYSYWDLYAQDNFVPDLKDYEANVECHNIGLNANLFKGNDMRITEIDIGHYSEENQVQMILETKKLKEESERLKKPLTIKIDEEMEKKMKSFQEHSSLFGRLFRQDYVRGMDKEDVITIKTDNMLPTTELSEQQSMSDGYSVYRAGDKIVLVNCIPIGVKVQVITCTKIQEITAIGRVILKAYRFFGQYYLIVRGTNDQKYELLRFNDKFLYLPKSATLPATETVTNDQTISLNSKESGFVDLKFDLKIIHDDIYVLCSEIQAAPEANDNLYIVQITINDGKIKDDKKDIVIKEVNFKNSAIQKFKCGSIVFLPDFNYDAYVLNSVPGQTTQGLVVWYEGVQKDLDLLITDVFKLNDFNQIDANYELCPLQESLVFFEKKSNNLFATNYDAPGESKITIPVLATTKFKNALIDIVNYKVDSLFCSKDGMFFQLLVTDTQTKKKYLNTYFSFDGVQIGRSIHSQVEVDAKVTKLMSKTLVNYSQVKILTIVGETNTFFDEKASPGVRKVFQINLTGPELYVCLNKYYFQLNFIKEIKPLLIEWYLSKGFSENKIQTAVQDQQKLYNDNPNYWFRGRLNPNKIKVTFSSGMKGASSKTAIALLDLYINDLQKTRVDQKELVFVPENAPIQTPSQMSSYFRLKGAVFEIAKSTKQLSKSKNGKFIEEFIEIQQKLTLTDNPSQVNYGPDYTILDSIGKNVLVRDNKNEKVLLLVNQDKERFSIDLKDSASNGHNQRDFRLFVQDRNIFIAFTYDIKLRASLKVISLEIYEVGFKELIQKALPFNYDQIEYTSDSRYLYFSFKSAQGDQILVWRIDNRSGTLARVTLLSRVPGEIFLTPRTVFGIVQVDSLPILYLLHPGKRYFQTQILDFQSQTVIGINRFYSQTNSTIYFMGLNNCPNPADRCLQGLIGGKTDRYQEFKIPVNLQERSVGKITFVFEYFKLTAQKSRVDKVLIHGGYYMLIGDFGQMETSREIQEAIKDKTDIVKITKYQDKFNEKPTQNNLDISQSSLTQSLGQGGTVERVSELKKKENLAADVGKMEDVKHLIYRKGEAEPFLKDAFMRGYGDSAYAKFEVEKNEVLYITKKNFSLKYFKIGDFQVKQIRIEDKSNSAATQPTMIDKPRGPINVAFYGQRYLGTQQIHPSQIDIIKSNLQLYFGLFFIITILLICFLGYKFSKTDEHNKQNIKKKSNVLLGVDFEKKKDNTDKQILKTYFGYDKEDTPTTNEKLLSKKSEAQNPFQSLLRMAQKPAETVNDNQYVSSDEEVIEARVEYQQDEAILNQDLDDSQEIDNRLQILF